MADVARPSTAARPSHRTQSSQDDFSRRLKHLQRSDPVDPQELTRRLNAAIIEAKYYGHRDGGRRRLANARAAEPGRSQSRTPSEASTPRQDVRQSTLNPLNVARSTLIWDGSRDDDPMSRVANALRALKDADPSRPASMISPVRDTEQKQYTEPRVQQQADRPEVSRAVARKSRAYSAPRVVEIEKPKEPLPRPQSSATSPVIADTLKQRQSRRAPAPLILTVVPKAAKPEMVDVSSPLTTKPATDLLTLEPLSPFGATFSENGGSFLVYQPNEVVVTDTPLALSPEQEEPSATVRNLSPMNGTVRRSPDNSIAKPPDYFTRKRPEKETVRFEERDQMVQRGACSSDDEGQGGSRHNTERWRRSTPEARLSQNSETDGTDGQSEQGMSPLFEISGAQSSRTSLGQPSSAGHNLKQMPAKETGSMSEDFSDLGFTPALSERVHQESPFDGVSQPVSPLQLPTDDYPYLEEEHSVSPVASPPAFTLPKRMSSLPPAPEEEPTNSKRHSIARKPVGSGVFVGSIGDSTIRQVFPTKPARHDSTGFTVAREFLRDSIDSEHVRHVHTAAKLSVDHGTFPQSSAPQLPKLSTSIPRPGKVEEIADGICLINSDSPIATKQMSRLPAPGTMAFRQPSYTKELISSPDASKHNSTAESPRSSQLSPYVGMAAQEAGGAWNAQSTELRRNSSRDRSNIETAVPTYSSRPDYRARPLIQGASEQPISPSMQNRPRTAGAPRLSGPSLLPPPPTKLPSKITFPPRANMAELNAMSPESVKLLHEQEALLRRRYDAVLNPIDDALRKKSDSAAPLELGPDGLRIPSPTGSVHSRSNSRDLRVSVGAMSTTNLDLMHHQENIAREQAAIRAQRRNLGAAARQPSAPFEGLSVYSPMRVDQQPGVYGGYQARAPAFTDPVANTKSAFTFDDDTQATRKRRPTWKFWKKK